MKIYLVAILLTIGLYCRGSLKGTKATAIIMGILVVSSLVHKEGVENGDGDEGFLSELWDGILRLFSAGGFDCAHNEQNKCPDPTKDLCVNPDNGQWACGESKQQCDDSGKIWCPDVSCDASLKRLCGQAALGTSAECTKCTGDNQLALQKGQCTATEIAKFCKGGDCTDVFKKTCPLDKQKNVGDCMMCVGEHQQEFEGLGCSQDDIYDYCKEWTPVAPPDVPQCPQIDRTIQACTQSECTKPNGDLKCGPANTYLSKSRGACINTCTDASNYEKDENGNPGDICYLNKGCKQNLCLPETVPSEVSDDVGKIKFKNQTNQGPMFVLFDKAPPALALATISTKDTVKAAVKQTIGLPQSEKKYFYQVDNSETLVFDISKIEWMSGKCYILGKDPKTAHPDVFNGSGLGGLEWSVTAKTCHTNLSAVDGINFDSEVNVYNIECGGQHKRTCQLDWASCPNKQTTVDGQLTCKAPMVQRDFMKAVCNDALTEECAGGWTFESECYMKNIINKYECLKAWGNPDGSTNPDVTGVAGGSLDNRQKWLQFVSNGGKCNIYPWSYGEQMIQEPSHAAPGTIDTIDFMKDDVVAMERTADNWVKSKDYLCLTSRKCGEFCDWKVVTNPNQPLIACEPNMNVNPPVKYPTVIFQINHIYTDTD